MQQGEKRKLLEKMLGRISEQLVLVEGKNDARALELAGIKPACVIAVQSRRAASIASLAAESGFAGVPVLLLFDFDPEGKRKAAEYEEILAASGFAVDRQGRKAFRALFRLRTLEELPHAMQEVEKEIG